MALALKEMEPQTKEKQAEVESEDGEAAHGYFEYPYVYTRDDEGYLVSDGQPMAESDEHMDEMEYGKFALRRRYAARAKEVYVSGGNFVHYKKGDFTKYLSPDCYVVFGVEQKQRQNYKSWLEGGHIPAIVFEFTSKKTRKADEGEKFTIYEQALKIPEYILFDPKGEYLKPRLKGWRLNAEGRYAPIAMDEKGHIYSERLDLFMVSEGEILRLIEAKTGERLRTSYEEAQQRQAEASRANAEEQRADAEARLRLEAEAENARLRAELEALRSRGI